MTDAKSTLDKVLAVLGMQAPVAEAPAVELEVAAPVIELEDDMDPELPIVPEEDVPVVEEEQLAIEDVVAALEARLKALEDHIAAMVAEEVVEEAPVAEAPVEVPMAKKKPMEMSQAKPFNGAPVEEKKMEGIYKAKTAGTLGSVYSKLF